MNDADKIQLAKELATRWPAKFSPEDCAYWAMSLQRHNLPNVIAALVEWKNKNIGTPKVNEIEKLVARYAAASAPPPVYQGDLFLDTRQQYQADDKLIDSMSDEVLERWKQATINAMPVSEEQRELYRGMKARKCRSLKLEICAAYRAQQQQEVTA